MKNISNKPKIDEQEDDNILKRQVARLTFKVGTKATSDNISDLQRSNLSTAINILTQAMLLSDSDKEEARRLLALARKVSRKK